MKKGRTKIGIISPANSIVGEKNIKLFQDGIKKLEASGFEVIIGENVYSTSESKYCGTIEEKLHDIYYVSSKAKYIICSTGGINSNMLLRKIDYNKIKNNIFIGNSNPVLLFNAFYSVNKVKSYIGPNVKSLGKISSDFSMDSLKNKTICYNKKISIEKNIITINDGIAKGIAIGGNIQSLRRIVGTKYFPKIKNYILYLEANLEETDFVEYESIIEQFYQLGIINNSNGIILGYYDNNVEFYKKIFCNVKVPVFICNNLGHDINNNMLPIGVRIIVNKDGITEW